METGRHARFALCTILAVAAFTVSGCGRQSAFTDEMRHQESEMLNETSQWHDQLAQWDTENGEMRAWHASHPVPSSSSAQGDKLKKHEEKMAEHEQNTRKFMNDLQEHLGRLQEENAKPEKDRTMAHAALWAEQLKLKTTFNMLAGAHEDLKKEHAEIVSGSTSESSPRSGS